MSTDPQPADDHWPLLPDESLVDPIARVARFLENLKTLAADRAMEEQRIDSRRETGLRMAQRTVQETREKLAQWFQRIGRGCHRARRPPPSRRSPASRSKAPPPNGNSSTCSSRPTSSPKPPCGWPSRPWKSSRWEAEAFFDGNKQIAPKQLEEFSLQVDAWRTKAGEEQDKARKLLRQWKQEPPQVTTDHEAFAAGGEDYAGRLPAGVAAITAQLEELESLRVPAAAASRAPAFYTCVALLSTAGATIELGAVAGGAVFVGTVVVWILITFWLRSTSRL